MAGPTASLVAPPEGVLAGDDVPMENQVDDLARAMIDEAVAVLKTRPEYANKSDGELREIAKEKLQ